MNKKIQLKDWLDKERKGYALVNEYYLKKEEAKEVFGEEAILIWHNFQEQPGRKSFVRNFAKALKLEEPSEEELEGGFWFISELGKWKLENEGKLVFIMNNIELEKRGEEFNSGGNVCFCPWAIPDNVYFVLLDEKKLTPGGFFFSHVIIID